MQYITEHIVQDSARPHAYAAILPNEPKSALIVTRLTTLLLRHTDGPTTATGGLGVLSTHTETPVVTETAVSPDLLQALEILTELGVDTVG